VSKAAKSENPFNPQFGVLPPLFIGRDMMINDFIRAVGNKNDPNRTTIVTGIRGSGKTAILTDVAKALESKCVVVDVTAHDGMLREILGQAVRKGGGPLKDAFGDVSSLSVGALGFSFGFSRRAEGSYGFRDSITLILEELAKRGTDLVILIDEANNDTPEMREFAICYQHLIREERGVYLLMAGLPSTVSDVLNDKVLTFLRRARRGRLEHLDEDLVASELGKTFQATGMGLPPEVARQVARGTKGYPYLIQLIGYYLWNSGELDANGAEISLERAKADLFRNVHDIMWRELSDRDREFLMAMSEDDEVTRFADVLSRMGVTKGYASKYRERLLDAGIVRSVGHGKLAMEPPYMREYVLRHA